ncbi:MAG: hypothetical protein WC254_05270 [Candidatus Woesearchaeota archaeon]|jgi:hypothetical protein
MGLWELVIRLVRGLPATPIVSRQYQITHSEILVYEEARKQETHTERPKRSITTISYPAHYFYDEIKDLLQISKLNESKEHTRKYIIPGDKGKIVATQELTPYCTNNLEELLFNNAGSTHMIYLGNDKGVLVHDYAIIIEFQGVIQAIFISHLYQRDTTGELAEKIGFKQMRERIQTELGTERYKEINPPGAIQPQLQKGAFYTLK